jgi:hypothetical protein
MIDSKLIKLFIVDEILVLISELIDNWVKLTELINVLNDFVTFKILFQIVLSFTISINKRRVAFENVEIVSKIIDKFM